MSTTNTGLNQPLYNSQGWDTPLNNNMEIVNGYVSLITVVSYTVPSTVTNINLTGPVSNPLSSSLGQVQSMVIRCSGTLTANSTLTFPAGISGHWIVRNSTGGAYTLTVKTATTGTTVVIPQGSSAIVYSDGTNIRFANDGGVTYPIGVTQGGTGLTTLSAANNALYSTSSTAIAAGTLPVAAGGTGSTTLAANSVLIGNGTGAVSGVAPGTSGNVLKSNGTAWTSAAVSFAPLPTTTTGVGKWDAAANVTTTPNSYTVPAGGTWVVWVFFRAGSQYAASCASGFYAGGSTITNGPNNASDKSYFAWRIS